MKIINFFTPTAHGEDILADTIDSIQKQTYPCKQPLLTDNEEAKQNVIKIIASLKPKRTLHYHLQENVTQEFHRPEPLLSGFVHLVKYDYYQLLGTGDWINPEHAQTVMDTFEKTKADWVFCLRNIWKSDKTFLCKDIFENLGFHPIYVDPKYYFVDGQCFILPKRKVLEMSSLWHLTRVKKMRTDKVLFDNLSRLFPNFKCTNQYTLNFRLGRGSKGQLDYAEEWYLRGEKVMKNKYPDGNYPWIK